MIIKVCGMREAENIREVEALGIDLMGFIFWEKSSRYISKRPAYLPTKCKRVGVFAQLQGLHLIKAISVSSRNDIATYKTYEGLVEYFLFDTKCPSVGGSGQQFDWSVLSAYDGSTPFLLSGGIGPDDAERIKSFHHPQCIGIDLNSRFELAPGLKDVIKLQAFIKELSI